MRRAARHFAERPIADRHRRIAFGACAAVLVVTTAVLSLIPDMGVEGNGGADPGSGRLTLEPRGRVRAEKERSPSLSVLRQARRAARRFLHSYLALASGRGSAAGVSGASRSVRRRLEALRVPPGSSFRGAPRITHLQAHQIGPGGVLVAARISSDGSVAYSIEVTVIWRAPRWIVTRVDAE